ncbi:CRISPR-associated protein Cas5 [Kyrpidia spormannii]|uniref:CRISPR-associated protein Cas5 n=1 Tax=Kyrpidia spormannii TaxID=2055160 RepID=A0A2K8NAK5_9BACL|nr:CRISPR-associated protein Cas5 [Kyrpidia spormannii]ATY85847.1 CRISPR-associated protein Cas5 [Kyrpidia spormannii]
MQLLVFDLRGTLAHFRRPDTTATHASYPVITRTALRGLLGSILGLAEFSGESWAGIQLLAPVRTVLQELSLLGKGFLTSGPAMNRPTSIELVVNPAYRIYYHGDYQEELMARIREGRSHYHTYLGSAFALTFPRFVGSWEVPEVELTPGMTYRCRTVLPTHVVQGLVMPPGDSKLQVGRIGGVHYHYLGGRRFRGAVHLVYEVQGQPISFVPTASPAEPKVRFAQLGDEVVCLW